MTPESALIELERLVYDLEASGFSRQGVLTATIAQNMGRLEAVQRRYSREAFSLLNGLVTSKAVHTERGMQMVNEQLQKLAQQAGLAERKNTRPVDEDGARIL